MLMSPDSLMHTCMPNSGSCYILNGCSTKKKGGGLGGGGGGVKRDVNYPLDHDFDW